MNAIRALSTWCTGLDSTSSSISTSSLVTRASCELLIGELVIAISDNLKQVKIQDKKTLRQSPLTKYRSIILVTLNLVQWRIKPFFELHLKSCLPSSCRLDPMHPCILRPKCKDHVSIVILGVRTACSLARLAPRSSRAPISPPPSPPPPSPSPPLPGPLPLALPLLIRGL